MRNFRVIESFRFFAALLLAFDHLFYILLRIWQTSKFCWTCCWFFYS